MCVEKIAYFNPTINGDFTYEYKLPDGQNNISLRFDFGLFKIKATDKTNYSLDLKIWKNKKNDETRVFENNYQLTDNLKVIQIENNYGNMNIFIGINNLEVEKGATYCGELSLKQDGKVLDTSDCYFEVI